MADEDKQFEASGHKLAEVRRKGQVIKSKDVTMALSLIVMFSVIKALAPFIWIQLSMLFVSVYEQIPNKSLDKIGLPYLLLISFIPFLAILVPFLTIALIISFIGEFMQVGPLFTTEPIIPNIDKLNPVNGFKGIFFSMRTYFELAKNIVKVLILGFVAYITFKAHFPIILKLCTIQNTFSLANEFGSIVIEFIIKASMLFAVIAVFDYLFVKWKFLVDQKMSFKEVKDEYKNTEGDPNIKAALRERQRQIMLRSMLEAIPTADFVTTNPVHIAVALRYNSDEMRAPKVIAKGTELFAKKIIAIAIEYNIPVIENPPVARALFRLVDLDREIPPELYKAVAEILMFVYNLRERKN